MFRKEWNKSTTLWEFILFGKKGHIYYAGSYILYKKGIFRFVYIKP